MHNAADRLETGVSRSKRSLAYEEEFGDYCGSLHPAAFVTHPYAVEEQSDLTVYIFRDPEPTLQELWPLMEGEQ